MRLKDANGSIKTVTEVIAAVELRHDFNGTKRRLLEPCKGSTVEPNALVFIYGGSAQQPMCMGSPFTSAEDKLLLGNLTSEQAEEIVSSLLKDGYADISGLKMQKQQLIVDQYKTDGGQSGAYTYAANGFSVFTNACMNGIFAQSEIPAEDEDDGELGEGADE